MEQKYLDMLFIEAIGDGEFVSLAKAGFKTLRFERDWRANALQNDDSIVRELLEYADTALDDYLNDKFYDLSRNGLNATAKAIIDKIKVRLAWLHVIDELVCGYANLKSASSVRLAGGSAVIKSLGKVVFTVAYPEGESLTVVLSVTNYGDILTKKIEQLKGLECAAKLIYGMSEQGRAYRRLYYCHLIELKPKLDEWMGRFLGGN